MNAVDFRYCEGGATEGRSGFSIFLDVTKDFLLTPSHVDTATPAEVQKIRLEDTSWILLDRTAKSCMSLANSYVTF